MKTFSVFSAAEAAGPGVLWSRSNRELYHRGVTYHYVYVVFIPPPEYLKERFFVRLGSANVVISHKYTRAVAQKNQGNHLIFVTKIRNPCYDYIAACMFFKKNSNILARAL